MSTPVPCNLSRARIKHVRAGIFFFFSSFSGLDIEFKLTWLTAAKSRTVTRFFVSTKKAPQSSTPDSEPHPVWLAKKKEQQLAANLWNVYSHSTDLALSIALMQRSQLDMTNAQ